MKFTSIPRARLGVSLSLPLFFLGPTKFVTLRLRGRPGRDGFIVHCGTVLGHAFSKWRQIRPQNSPTMHFVNHLDPVPVQPRSGKYGMHTHETFRTNEERYGHFPKKEQRFDCCYSSDGGIY